LSAVTPEPEAWRTDPRERLLASIDSTWAYGELGATPEQLVDAYTHQLAETIRSDPYLGDEYASLLAADFIDPHLSAGPERPDEEQP
jgi:hypothetical protein